MSNNPYDQGCRYLAKQRPDGMTRWLLRLAPNQVHFRGWIDARRVCFPGEPERTCDTVAFLEDGGDGQAPWAVPFEVQIAPDVDRFPRLLGYLGGLGLEARLSDSRGDRFRLGAVVVNLTGRGNASRDMRWPAAGLATQLAVREVNLADEDADATLSAVEAGEADAVVLPFIVLMHGESEEGIIVRWVALASAEPDARFRADLGGLALVFAEATGHAGAWKKALEGWNVMQSKQVMEWQAQARVEGLEKGRVEGVEKGVLIGQIQMGQRLLHQAINSREDLLQMPLDQLSRLADQLEAQLLPRTNGAS